MKNYLQIPLILMLVSLSSISSSQQWALDLPEGTPFPNINALDQHGETWTNKTLIGEKGLIFSLYDPATGDPSDKKHS